MKELLNGETAHLKKSGTVSFSDFVLFLLLFPSTRNLAPHAPCLCARMPPERERMFHARCEFVCVDIHVHAQHAYACQ